MNKDFVDPGDVSLRKETDASEMMKKMREWNKFE